MAKNARRARNKRQKMAGALNNNIQTIVSRNSNDRTKE
jgi:hypothetical protein